MLLKIITRLKDIYNRKIRKSGRANYNESFQQNEFIFIHIPKTAGISVVESLLGKDKRVGHSKALEYYNLDSEKFHKYYKFAFVRNPWDRFYSCYNFLKKGGITPPDRKWSEKYMKEIDNFHHFCEKMTKDLDYQKLVMNWKHFLPQHLYVCDKNGDLIVDFVARFESIDEDFQTIRNNLGIGTELVKKNVSRTGNSSYHKYYNAMGIKLVENLYSKDIELFKYKFD